MKFAANDILNSNTNKENQIKATRQQHAALILKSHRLGTNDWLEAEGDWNTGACVHSILHDLREKMDALTQDKPLTPLSKK